MLCVYMHRMQHLKLRISAKNKISSLLYNPQQSIIPWDSVPEVLILYLDNLITMKIYKVKFYFVDVRLGHLNTVLGTRNMVVDVLHAVW